MKYIEADKVKAEIDKIIDGLKGNCDPNPLGTTEECLAAAEIEALDLVKDIIEVFCQRPHKTMLMVTHYREEYPKNIDHEIYLRKIV